MTCHEDTALTSEIDFSASASSLLLPLFCLPATIPLLLEVWGHGQGFGFGFRDDRVASSDRVSASSNYELIFKITTTTTIIIIVIVIVIVIGSSS